MREIICKTFVKKNTYEKRKTLSKVYKKEKFINRRNSL